jgi:ribulose-phosphate 3-epimerase
MYKLSPSLLAADFGILKQQLEELDKANVPYLHLDIMDGVFVPNLSFGLAVVQSIRKYTKIVFDVHLMIIEPERYVEQFAKAGADIFCFHIEATEKAKELIAKIKDLGMKAAIALKPATPISTIEELLPELDMVLVMTVEPGFGGQKFMQDQMEKVKDLVKLRKENNYNYDIEVDGGVNPETIKTCFAAGANVIVAGSAVMGAKDISARVKEFAEIAKDYTL